jgi:predicted O-linked N-acetylglucosamine transferase (SPINDLY family)
MQRLACADIYLDAWPCNAHTTAGEALWVGVPVVPLTGELFAQRVAASLLETIGLPQLICHDVDGYVNEVASLAGNAARCAELRERLQTQRTASALFDGERFARDIEALYDRMWERAVAGLPPEHLSAA